MTVAGRNIDNFVLKMKQRSAIDVLKKYILYARMVRGIDCDRSLSREPFSEGPLSINLDITVACNYSCTHCVDNRMLNKGDSLTQDEMFKTIEVLHSRRLKSVILIGGGEPLLHRQVKPLVHYIKSLNLQLGIVTNGSKRSTLLDIAKELGEGDWMRFSIDAATEKTFREIHRPRTELCLEDICKNAQLIKQTNDSVSLGFSYVIIWEGCEVEGTFLKPNVDEMPAAVDLALRSGFDYISFKPCLIKSKATSNRETLLFGTERAQLSRIRQWIEPKIIEARERARDGFGVIESINLRAMFGEDLLHYKIQPETCHSQVFRQVVSPIGIYHCPAYRGEQEAFISEKYGYASPEVFHQTVRKNLSLLKRFNAREQCKDVVCIYNRVNWWIEDFINSREDVDSIEILPDDNFFL